MIRMSSNRINNNNSMNNNKTNTNENENETIKRNNNNVGYNLNKNRFIYRPKTIIKNNKINNKNRNKIVSTNGKVYTGNVRTLPLKKIGKNWSPPETKFKVPKSTTANIEYRKKIGKLANRRYGPVSSKVRKPINRNRGVVATNKKSILATFPNNVSQTNIRPNTTKKLPNTRGEFLNRDFNTLVKNTNNIFTRGLKLVYSKSVYTQIKKFLSIKNTNSRKQIITEQIKQIQNNYLSLSDTMKSRDFNKYTRGDTNFEIDFLFLIWLDLTHDGSTNRTFQQFLKSNFKNIFIKSYITLPLGNTPMINNILNLYTTDTGIKQDSNGIISKEGTGSWEKTIKHNLDNIFKINEGISILPTQINANSIKSNVTNPLLVHIDAESKRGVITKLQERSKVEDKRKIMKFNNITNLIDPGVYKSNSFESELSPFLTQNSPKSRHYWNFDETNLKIGNLWIKPTLNDTYILNNGKRVVNAGVSAAQASTAANTTNIDTILGKFLGDFAQILYLANLSHSRQGIALGTNDAMMSAMYIFIFTRCKIKNPPLLIIDTGENNNALFYGFNDRNYINLSKGVKNTSVHRLKTVQRAPNTNMTMRNNRFPSSSKRNRTMSRLTTINESFNSPSPLTNKKRPRISAPTSTSPPVQKRNNNNNNNNKNRPTKKRNVGVFRTLRQKLFKF